MSDLSALIAKVEEAGEGARELDARIAVLSGDVIMRESQNGIAFFSAPINKGDWAFLSGCKQGEDDAFKALGTCLSTKHYTTDLSAALALTEKVLPRDWAVGFEWGQTGTLANAWVRWKYSEHSSEAQARTPALALVLATLRALKAKEA